MKKGLILLCMSFFVMAAVSLRDARPAILCIASNALDRLEGTKHALIAKLAATNNTIEEDDNRGFNGTAILTVEKVYKGGMKPGEKINLFRTTLGFSFEERDIGREYLLYLGEPQGNPPRYALDPCGGGDVKGPATEDILYLNNISNVRGKTRISGRLTLNLMNSSISPGGMIITIRQGGKAWEAPVDSNGIFEIYDLPAGEYEIEPPLPYGWGISSAGSSSAYIEKSAIDNGKIPVVVGEKPVSVRIEIQRVPDNMIKGRLLSPSGQTVQGAQITMEDIDGRSLQLAITDINGEFEIRAQRSGKYVLTVDNFHMSIEDIPFRKFYYPGVTDREKAEVFSIAPGAFFKDAIFRIPAIESKFDGALKISATVLYPDGKTVDDENNAFLRFTSGEDDKGRQYYSIKHVFENGKYRMDVPKGIAGKLIFEISTDIGDLRSCPEKLEKMDAISKFDAKLRSNEVLVSGEEDTLDVILRLPETPYCENNERQSPATRELLIRN